MAREKSERLGQELKTYLEKGIHSKPTTLAHWEGPLVYRPCRIGLQINMVHGQSLLAFNSLPFVRLRPTYKSSTKLGLA